jgi:hypothetical protein
VDAEPGVRLGERTAWARPCRRTDKDSVRCRERGPASARLQLGSGDRALPAYWNRLTTRAMIKPTIANEMSAWDPIATLAHGTIGIVSVGLNALAVVNPTYR